jgi:hypothetical protein
MVTLLSNRWPTNANGANGAGVRLRRDFGICLRGISQSLQFPPVFVSQSEIDSKLEEQHRL